MKKNYIAAQTNAVGFLFSWKTEKKMGWFKDMSSVHSKI
jgi:hypothetical protein